MKAVIIKPYSSMSWLPPSHSLYGQIFVALSLLLKQDEFLEVINAFANGNPPFLISSSFPFINNSSKRIFFLPMPLHLQVYSEDKHKKMTLEEYREFKRFKKIKYLPSEYFFKLCNGDISIKDFFYSKQWQQFEPSQLGIKQITVFHNSIHRFNNIVTEGLLYDTNELFFKDGFYFLIEGDDSLVCSALNFLSDFGIGGNNSTGKGQFSWSIENADFITNVEGGNYYVSLSSYLPDKDEIDKYKNSDNIFYTLEQFRGIIGTHFIGNKRIWKKKVIVFLPGSVFPLIQSKNNIGCVVEVKSKTEGLPYPIYFVGFSLGIKIKL